MIIREHRVSVSLKLKNNFHTKICAINIMDIDSRGHIFFFALLKDNYLDFTLNDEAIFHNMDFVKVRTIVKSIKWKLVHGKLFE